MESDDVVLKVIMEDAGCERLDKACLENILSLIKEGKYPKLSEEEIKELDKGLASLVAKLGLRDLELSQEASKVALEQTSTSLSHGLEEETKPTTFEEVAERKNAKKSEKYTATERETVARPAPVIKVKSSKTPLIISLIALLLSLGTLALLTGYLNVPHLEVPTINTLNNLNDRVSKLEARVNLLQREVVTYKKFLQSEISKLKSNLKDLNIKLNKNTKDFTNNITTLREELRGLERKLEELNGMVSIQGKEIVRLKRTLKALNESFNDKLSKEVKKLNDYVNNKLKELDSTAKRLEHELMTLNITLYDNLNKLKSEYATKEQVNSLENKLNALNATINNIVLKLKVLNDLNAKLVGLENELKSLRNEVNSLYALKNEIEKVKTSIVKLNTSLSNMRNYIDEKLKEEVLPLNETLKRLQTNVEQLNYIVGKIDKDLSKLQSEVATLKNTLKNKIAELMTSKMIVDQIAKSLITKAKFDKLVAERLLSNATAFYELVKRIAEETCINMTLSSQGGLVNMSG